MAATSPAMTRMSQLQTPTISTKAASRDAFVGLNLLGWSGGLAALVVGLAVSFLLFGYFVTYYRNADMDFMVIYSALAMNAGHPQQFMDHTAYLTILTLKDWFALLHSLGLLDAWTLPAMPKDAAGFDLAMTHAVHAGRVLAFLIATGSVLIFASLSRLMFRDWRIALTATLAFALSGGVAVHSRILRSELVAACPVIFALMILIVIGRRAHPARPLGMAAAAALCVVGMENKVQAILLIGALPLLILPFGSAQGASVGFWRTPASWLAAIVTTLAALAAAWMAWPLVVTGLDRALLDEAQFHPLLLNRYGVYQLALLVFVAICMIAFAAIWRVSVAETLTSMSAVALGAAAALLLLNVDYNTGNVIAVVNPMEKMLTFADASTSSAASGSSPLAVILLLLDGLASVLARYIFVLHSSPRPTVFLAWLILPGIVFAWRRGERLVALQAALLMAVAIGIDTLGVRRGLKIEYFIFTDPLIILSGAILLEQFSDLSLHRWAFPIAATLFGLHIAVGQSEPIKYAFMRKGPQSICEWNRYYMPLMSVPWCPT
jgi:hypothetical protein